MSTAHPVAVVGAGSWGTALAATVARTGAAVRLWARDPALADAINRERQNRTYLDGIALDDRITATADMADLAGAEAVFMVTPAQALGPTARALARYVQAGTPVVICAKGIEQGTGRLMSEVLADAMPDAACVILSGPGFARDVVQGKPTAVTLAGDDEAVVRHVSGLVATPFFRPYLSTDVKGAQAGGSIKNVLAIACGIVEGKQFGESARAALTSRGFAELHRFGISLGGRAETLAGLSGLGDLILTCGSLQSRNMSLGAALGRGETMPDILASRRAVSEGVHTAPVLMELARRMNIELPVCDAVNRIIGGEITVDGAIAELLHRPLKREELEQDRQGENS